MTRVLEAQGIEKVFHNGDEEHYRNLDLYNSHHGRFCRHRRYGKTLPHQQFDKIVRHQLFGKLPALENLYDTLHE